MDHLQFSHQITSTISPLPHSPLYKIFGEQFFSFSELHYQNKSDWSGFYTQLTPQHSLRYLTKKWDDGANFGCLIRIIPKCQELTLLRVNHSLLSSVKVSGKQKAGNIKNHLRLSYPEFEGIMDKKLMKYLGDRKMVMQCIDSQDNEIIIPHDLLLDDNFLFNYGMHFKKSNDGFLRTVNYRFANDQNWKKMPNQYQFQPYLILTEKQTKSKLDEVFDTTIEMTK